MKILLIIFILFFIPGNCFGWEITDEANTHSPINEAAVSYFLLNFNNNIKTLDEQIKFFGIAWHSGLAESIIQNNEGISRIETFREWVKAGGVDADVESKDAERIVIKDSNTNKIRGTISIGKPLRHFYDPIFENKRYLTDFPGVTPFKNPEIDHVQWALHKTEHHWSFDQGLLLYKAAMENKDLNDLHKDIANFDGYFTSNSNNIRDNLFAASFRALGETLHGVADLCLPAHVRDDSHGGLGGGGVDPIEDSIKFVVAQKILSETHELPSNDFLKKSKTVEEILIGCASFTNANFFSNDTICNKFPKVGPSTNNKKNYPEPSFLKTDLIQVGSDTKIFRVYANFFVSNAQPIILTQLTITSYVGMFRTEKYSVPMNAADGQASVLLPLAAAAGGEVIDRFFPTMKLTLEVKDEGQNGFTLSGNLIHEIDKDPTWKDVGAIKYNGTGEIRVKGSTVATATFVDGVMTPLLNQTFKENDKVQLVVSAGALIHKSPEAVIQTTETATVNLTYATGPDSIAQVLQKVEIKPICVGYIGTPKPAVMATVFAKGNNIIAYNWWCDDAQGTWVSDYYAPFTKSIFPNEDFGVFGQVGSAPRELKPKIIANTMFFCAPAGNHTLHIRAYYGNKATVGLLKSPNDINAADYVQKDITFTVQPAVSPVTYYKNNVPWEEISFKETTSEDEFTGPEWAPTNWKRLKFEFDGPYTFYEKYPTEKAVGEYKSGVRVGLWKIITDFGRTEFEYDKTGIIKSLDTFDKDGSLKAHYTQNSSASPTFSVGLNERSIGIGVCNAVVQTYDEPKEKYQIKNNMKNGAYQAIFSNGKTEEGQFLNGAKTGTWKIYDPKRTPSDYTISY